MRALFHTSTPASRRRSQKGQAIVLIAFLMVVLLGLLGLALDSGRGYVDRREMQDAADAAALAAGDSYENFADPVAASALAIHAFAENERISNIGAPSYFSSNPQTYTFPSDPTFRVTITIANNSHAGTLFTVAPSHQIPVAIMQVLGVGPTITVSTIASALVGNQNATPALLTLSQGGCGNNPGNSLVLQGSTSVVIHGDVYSNGTTGMGGSSSFTIGGNAYTNCGGTPASINYWCYSADPNQPPYQPPCVYPDAIGSGMNGAPILLDPGYPSGVTGNQSAWYPNFYGSPGYENQPGTYTGFSITGGGGCDWLAPGVYTMSGGFTDHGHQTTNMLKPPDEPVWNNDTVRMSPQFFDAGGCAPNPGFVVSQTAASGSGRALAGTYGVVVTSTRTDYYPPSIQPGSVAFGRESAPSMCRTVTITGANNGISVQIFKMPGATGYNIYLSPTACSTTAQFGYAESVGMAGGQGSSVTAPVIDKGVIGPTFTPSNTQCPYTVPATFPFVGCLAPDGEAAPYNSPTATLQVGLNAGQAYTSITVDSTLGQTTAGSAEVLATGGNTTQTVTVAAGSTNTVLNVLPFVANAAYPALTSTISITNSLANESPPKGLLPAGDRANENQCWPQTRGTPAQPCSGAAVTPGGVQFDFPTSSDCLSENGNGGTEVFSGRQFNFIMIWFSPANTCSPTLNGGSFTQYIGTIYMPAANLTINGGNKAPVAGQVICYTAFFSGNAGISIDYNPDTAPSPPAARLVL
jgi:Flp pilus assembly protein TadG